MNKDRGSTSICPVCDSTRIARLVEISQVPIHCNLLWPTRERAIQAPRADIRLGFCEDCGHIFNLAFKPELMEYSQAYDNTLHFSHRFQRYARALAARLIERYNLRGKDIIEIGCGSGEFLTLLCELGDNHGVGFDPAHPPGLNSEAGTERVTFIRDFYSERHAGYKADLICCRHVLEHIHDPTDFLGMLRRTIGERLSMVVFFEVPSALFTVRDLAIWDIIYEHCSYFSPGSLARAFASCGFDVREVSETYEGQFLTIEASPSEGSAGFACEPTHDVAEMADHIAAFVARHRTKIGNWQHHLERIGQAGKRMVVWGAGSKGVTFLNMLKIQDQIGYVVDINPRKQGMYIAGTGQRIVPPAFLRDYRPSVVVVMNPAYRDEIQQLTKTLGLTVEFVCA